jgi:hypothetical protein
MSNARALQEQIVEIISQTSLAYRPDGDVLDVLAPPADGENQSTAVRVLCQEIDNGNVVVEMFATVIYELPTDDEEIIIKSHVICNALNQKQVFGRWVYYPERGEIHLEHELIGESLGPRELISVVASLGSQADRFDETIQNDLGVGRRLLQDAL